MSNFGKASCIKKLVTGCLMVGVFSSFTAIAEVAVVVHPSNDASLDKGSIGKLFLGKKKKFSNGRTALPINAPSGASVRDEFNEKVVGRNSSQVKAYWSKLLFTGKWVPPKEIPSDAEVIALIAANPDTIGYVDAGSVTDAVKVVGTF